jgi:glycerol-3-phosphate cytidylyltransferase-like family protein
MVLPGFISNPNQKKKVNVNIMLDPCSTGSYISEHAAEELKLQGRTQHLTVTGTGGTEVQKMSRRVNLNVSNVKGNFSATVEANVLDDITGTTPAIEWSDLKENWPHLQKVPLERVANRRQIDLLIGIDHPLFHHVLQEIHGPQADDPIARRTNLGWVCFGPTSTTGIHNNSRIHVTRTYRSSLAGTNHEESTNNILRQFWELESMGIKHEDTPVLTPDEARATKFAEETLHKQDNRYEIGIPWKVNEPIFKSNYDQALSRLQSLERSLLKKGSDIGSSYNSIIEEYVEKGYVKKVPRTAEEDQWYLPHFPVIRNDKTTSKVRIVFDAAAKHDGKCLNDAVLPGPKLQRELVDVLCRFRRAPVALSADISQMFLQVGLRSQDRPYHRFLWRNFDQQNQPEIYEFQRLPFGNAASPFCAQYVLQTHGQTLSEEKSKVAETIDNSMYVDDVLDSFETIEEACSLRRDLSEVLSDAGFKLRKWLSNETSVIADVPIEDRVSGVEITEGKDLPTQKTLGVTWNAEHVYLSSSATHKFYVYEEKRFKLHCIPFRPTPILISIYDTSEIINARNLGSRSGLG